MRKSREETAKTRVTIVEAAADHLRKTGIAESSVADLMAAAGLTHGGFYRHFDSKEQLVAEALVAAGRETLKMIDGHIAKRGVVGAVDSYLSPRHRDAGVPTCPFAALGSEIRHAGAASKKASETILQSLLVLLSQPGSMGRPQAIAVLATMVGAMTLARAVSDVRLSNEILGSARSAARAQLTASTPTSLE